ncbi:MAG: hypothetical protein HY599_05180 [Candidatus Omnitrophica bacterium]|nr:hypothetical protein [Candidatus Omnitrophota bacterium]
MAGMPLDSQEPITFTYTFVFENGDRRTVQVTLDPKTLDVVRPPQQGEPPRWAAMAPCQCPTCPLKSAERPTCPAAINLGDILTAFVGHRSEEKTDISIETPVRTYVKRTSLQQGITSLIGIYMVGSGCPVLGKLKPMVRYHLPFATLEETQYRALSMYLLAQYLLSRRGQKPDWKLHSLVQMYKDIQLVNEHILTRLSAIDKQDPSVNALVILEALSYAIAFSVDKEMLDEIEVLFRAYFERPA